MKMRDVIDLVEAAHIPAMPGLTDEHLLHFLTSFSMDDFPAIDYWLDHGLGNEEEDEELDDIAARLQGDRAGFAKDRVLLDWLSRHLEAKWAQTMNGLQWEGDAIHCWRVLNRPASWARKLVAGMRVGQHWTYDWHGSWFPMPTGKKGHDRVRLHGLMPASSVDWFTTLLANAHPRYDEERELFPQQGASIRLLEVAVTPDATIDFYDAKNGPWEPVLGKQGLIVHP